MTTDEMIKALVDELRKTGSPLATQLRRNVREAVQAELVDERAGDNPPTAT